MSDTPVSANIASTQNTIPAFLDSVTSQFIVSPLTPSIIGVSGFVFDIIGNEEISLDSEITDSYTETNTTYQDQIALRPEQFTLSGYVGELVKDFSNQFTNIITALAAFGNVPGLGVNFNAQDQQFYDQLALIQASEINIVNTAESVYSLFSNFSTTATKQQNAFQYFYNLWLSRTLCMVETPWGVLENMAILNVRARQDEITRMVTDISVTFKAMRFANTATTTTVSTGAQADIPIPSIVGSDQANSILQSVPDNGGTVAGKLTSSTSLSNYQIGLANLGTNTGYVGGS